MRLFPYYFGVAIWLAIFLVGINEGALRNKPRMFFGLAALWPLWFGPLVILMGLFYAFIRIADWCGVDPDILYPKNHPRRQKPK